MKLINKKLQILFMFLLMLAGPVNAQNTKGSYKLIDFHQHTTFTDGSFSLPRMLEVCDSIGLAWWANSEHGGTSNRNGILSGIDLNKEVKWTSAEVKGDKDENARMWRWQTIKEYSFPFIEKTRSKYPNRVIIQGLEWNVPGHEHASMAILTGQFDGSPSADAIAQFEYQFDRNDKDMSGGKQFGWVKSSKEGHEQMLEALAWLQEEHPKTSWVVPAHPDRAGSWTISHFRDGNNIAPDIFYGFEGIPGHQKSAKRGGYGNESTYGGTTYGSAGWMVAKVGGLWDALLSEGRRWWLFSTSDFHNLESDFYPGEYNKTYLYMPEKINPYNIADYLRSGNCFVVSGNFVNGLKFVLNNHTKIGETLFTNKDEVTVDIEITQPENTQFPLDHIDLIEGVISDYKMPGTSSYEVDTVSTTRVIATFDTKGKMQNNKFSITHKLQPSAPYTYYRLRGTHHKRGAKGEADLNGNPLADVDPNDEAMAMSDQWFYSNPIFVKDVRNAVEVVVHRGANKLAPENTVISAIKAIEYGAKWIEVDVRSSKDGILYNFHDPIMNRTTNGSGLFKNLNSSEIDKLDAGSWFDVKYKNSRVPKIEEMIKLAKERDVNVYFDVKDCDLQSLIDMVYKYELQDKSFFWFGKPHVLQEFVRLAPNLKVKVNASNVQGIKEWMKVCKPAFVETNVKNVTPLFRAFCKSNNIKIMSSSGNSKESFRHAILSEVDMVNIDEPETFQEVINEF